MTTGKLCVLWEITSRVCKSANKNEKIEYG